MRMTKAIRGRSLGGMLAAWLVCAAIVAGLVSPAAPAEAVEESRGAAPVELVAPDGVAPDAGDGGIQVLPPDDDGDDTPQPGEGTDGIQVQEESPGDGAAGEGQPLGAQDDAPGGARAPRAADEGVLVQAQDGADVASGTWGTCPWEISADGVLTVRPGVGAGYAGGGRSPWAGHADRITSVVFEAEGGERVVAPANCRYLLYNLGNVVGVDASGLDTALVTDMRHMFRGCSKLSSLNLSDWATGKVTDMSYMFYGCKSLSSLNLSDWATGGVTNMSYMFQGCSSLSSLDLSGWDTGKVTDMSFMFYNCSSLSSLDLSGWDTGKVTDMSFMFYGCKSLSSLNLSDWATGGVTNMSYMFQGCSSLSSLDLSGWDTGKVADMSFMFRDCPKLGAVYVGASWSTAGVSVDNSYRMFYDCTSLVGGAGTTYDAAHVDAGYARPDSKQQHGYLTGPLATGTWGECPWQISGRGVLTVRPGAGAGYAGDGRSPWAVHASVITSVVFKAEGDQKVIAPANCSGLLYGLYKVTYVDASGLDTSGVTNMSSMFSGCFSLTSLDLSGWDTGEVTDMGLMFSGCSSLSSLSFPDGWATRKVKSMASMFNGCTGLSSLDLSRWDTGEVTDMGFMFEACPSLSSLSFSDRWATGKVTSMASMFHNCFSLASLDLSGWDTGKVTDMRYMFYGCSKLRAVYVGGFWFTGSVTSSGQMFSRCASLVGGAGTAYDGGHVDGSYARVDRGKSGPGYLTAAPGNTFFEIDGTYTVSNSGDWDVFCDLLARRQEGFFDGKTVRLGADVGTADAPVTRMAGGEGHAFTGTFDGCGHALTVRYGTARSPVDQQYAAPFRNVESGCVIEDLRVEGDIYASAQYAGGIVGSQSGTVAIEGCRVGVAIRSSVPSGGRHGGLVGRVADDAGSILSVAGCAFVGKLLREGSSAPSTDCGGFVGHRGNGTVSVADSLCAPAAPAGGEKEITDWVDAFVHYDHWDAAPTFSNCYYTRFTGTGMKQGKAARAVTAGEGVDLAPTGEATRYGASGIVAHRGGAGLVWDGTLYAGAGDVASLSLSVRAGYVCAGFAADAGTLSGGSGGAYGLTMPDEDVTITATSLGPDPAHLSQDGDAYTIHTAVGWDVFCALLEANPKGCFSGKTVRLAADIGTAEDPVTRMAGGSGHDFTGTFDGCGHTLTVRYGSADSPVESDKAAPFRNVESGCVIEDLRVEGDIYTSAKCAGGIVGTQYGAVSIVGCGVGATIHGLTGGDGTHGGLVGRNGDGTGSSLTIRGCAFYGKVLSEGGATTNCAGFVGWRHQTVTVTDSLYAPAALGAGEQEPGGGSATFVRNGDGATITNCYYTRALGDAQGKAARSVKAGEGVAHLAVVPVGDAMAPAHATSGITAYANGIERVGTYYFGAGDEVALSLGAVERLGYSHAGYQASAGTLSGGDAGGYALTMPDEDVTVAAAYEPVDNAPLAQVLGHSLTLKGSVGVNTYLLVGDTISSDAAYVVEFWRGGELARSERVSDADEVRQSVGGRTYLARRLTVTAVAKEMDVKFAMKIKAPDGTYVDFADTKGTPINGATGLDYSVNDYLNDMAQNGGTKELRQLCEDMRNYGAYARHYFGKRDDAGWGDPRPVVAGFEPVSEGDLKGFAPTLQQPEIAHFTYVGSTLVLEDETRFRLYFTSDDPTKLVAKYRVSGTQDTPADLVIEKGSGGFSKYHYVEVPNIVAKQLGDMYEFTFTNTDKNQTARVKHGPYAYVRWAVGLAGEDDGTVNLRYVASALYRYGVSAKAYFPQQQ